MQFEARRGDLKGKVNSLSYFFSPIFKKKPKTSLRDYGKGSHVGNQKFSSYLLSRKPIQ
jgi:hypothetical protein